MRAPNHIKRARMHVCVFTSVLDSFSIVASCSASTLFNDWYCLLYLGEYETAYHTCTHYAAADSVVLCAYVGIASHSTIHM